MRGLVQLSLLLDRVNLAISEGIRGVLLPILSRDVPQVGDTVSKTPVLEAGAIHRAAAIDPSMVPGLRLFRRD